MQNEIRLDKNDDRCYFYKFMVNEAMHMTKIDVTSYIRVILEHSLRVVVH